MWQEGGAVSQAVQILYVGAFALLAVLGVYYLVVTLLRWRIRSTPATRAPLADPLPHVSVQVPLRNERYVTDRVLEAVGRLQWPRDRLEVQVIDDSDDGTKEIAAAGVQRLQAAGIRAVHIQRPEPVDFKAGALNKGLESARGEFIAVFDADFVPPPDFLERTIPHFAHEQVACVQTRWSHLNERSSLLSRCLVFALDAHFMVEQRVRSKHGLLMSFNATSCVWRAGVLREVGGWPTRTITEDLDLSMLVLLQRRTFVYLDEPASPAEVPVETMGFKRQQARWARGGMQNLRCHFRALFTARTVRPMTRLDAAFHLTHYAIHPLVLALLLLHPFLLFWDLVPRGVLAGLVITATLGPTLMLATGQRVLHPQRGYRRLWRIVPLSLFGIGLSLRMSGAVLAGLLGPRGAFHRTPKYRLERDRGSWRDKEYKGRLDGWVLAEAALGIMLAVTAVAAITMGRFVAVPGAVVGAVALLTVAWMGLDAGRGKPVTDRVAAS